MPARPAVGSALSSIEIIGCAGSGEPSAQALPSITQPAPALLLSAHADVGNELRGGRGGGDARAQLRDALIQIDITSAAVLFQAFDLVGLDFQMAAQLPDFLLQLLDLLVQVKPKLSKI